MAIQSMKRTARRWRTRAIQPGLKMAPASWSAIFSAFTALCTVTVLALPKASSGTGMGTL